MIIGGWNNLGDVGKIENCRFICKILFYIYAEIMFSFICIAQELVGGGVE